MNSKVKRRSKGSGAGAKLFYSQLSPDQLEKLAAPFEKELVASKPLTSAMRAQERRARNKRGRPVIGEGSEKVLISMERALLRETDAYAKKHKKNRSQVIVEGLRTILFPRGKRKAS